MSAAQFLEDSDRSQPGSGLQHWNDFIVPDVREWIGSAPFPGRPLLGWKSWIFFKPVSDGRAESSFGGGDGRRMGATQVHEKPHLTIGDMSAGQRIGPLQRENRPLTQPPLPPDGALRGSPPLLGQLRSGYALPSSPQQRHILILIVAGFSS
jgi:hypothetical protein